jgi:hypothetical protein
MTETLLTIVALLLLADLVLTLLANERIRNAIRAGNRQALDLGLARLEALREQLEKDVTVRLEEAAGRLGRFALEATGEQAGIDQVIRVTARPAPALVALGRGFAHYVFTTAPPEVARRADGLLGDRPRRVRGLPIDASTSGLTAAAELSTLWTLLAEKTRVPLEDRALPRASRWYLYVVPQPPGERPGRR